MSTAKHKFHFVLLLLCVNIAVRAQVMTLKENDLDNSRNVSFGGNVFGVDIYNPNLAFIIEGKFCYRIKNELGWIRANYTLGWLDRIEGTTESDRIGLAVPAGGSQAMLNMGGSIGFNFIKKEQFKIARQTFLNSKRKDVKIPVKFYRLYGLHAGYEMFRTIIAQGSTTSYTGTVSKDLPHDTDVVAEATPMLNMNIISFGIHRQWLENYVLHVNHESGASEYKSRSSTIIFADFLFAINMQFDNILVPFNQRGPNSDPNFSAGFNEPYNFYEADINNSYRKVPFGARLGVEQISLGPVGFMMGAEIGFRPGIFDPFYNMYILAKVGVSFNAKIK